MIEEHVEILEELDSNGAGFFTDEVEPQTVEDSREIGSLDSTVASQQFDIQELFLLNLKLALAMLDMYSRIEELEQRIEDHNQRASHKI